MKDEVKIITLGDIFKNIETEEKAFRFKNYIKDLQEENQRLKDRIDFYEDIESDRLAYIDELEKQLADIKFYIEQSDIKNMLWGKEILEIIGGNDD